MQRILGRESIRNTLRLVLLITSCSALALATAGFSINDWLSARSQLFDKLQSEAKIIGNNTVAALMFSDGEAAERTLNSLKSEGNIVDAVLFSQSGRMLARYQRDDDRTDLIIPPSSRGELDGLIYVMEDVVFDGENLGKILLWSDHSDWQQRQIYRLSTAFIFFLL